MTVIAPLLEFRAVHVAYDADPASPAVVADANLQLGENEILGLVGASGAGKSTIGQLAVGLLTARSGQVLYRGKDLALASRSQLRAIRREVQMVWQDPYDTLDPRMRVHDIIAEGWDIYRMHPDRDERRRRVAQLLVDVGLDPSAANFYPSRFSGGQRQRIGIARALAMNPRVLICDEPLSALDLSIQAQIVNLLLDLQAKLEFSCLFISHDLPLVRFVSDRIVMLHNHKLLDETAARALLNSEGGDPFAEAMFASNAST